MKRVMICAVLGVLVVGIIGCENDDGSETPVTGKSTKAEMTLTEENHQRLVKAVPAPKLKDSLERRNLVKFLEYWNNPSRLSYIYLVSRSGTVIAHYVIKGKVTYCCSKLTTRDQLVEAPFVSTYSNSGINKTSKIESPGLDGSYGPSEDAIFFFTAENPDVPVLWKGDYLVSGVPMNLQTKPILLRTVPH